MPETLALAEYLESHLDSQEEVRVLADAIRLLGHSNRDLSPETVASLAAPDVPPTVSRNFVIQLEQAGVLAENVDFDQLTSIESTTVALLTSAENQTDALVGTIPRPETTVDSTRFQPLLLELRQLIKSAENRIILISPFFHEQAVQKLAAPLESCLSRGVDIDIVMRNLATDSNWNNQSFVRSLYRELDSSDRIRLFEYLDDESGTTLHTKLLAVDDSQCYLGSANITHYGLAQNLEFGVIKRGDLGAELTTTANEIVRSNLSHPVEYVDDARGFSRI